MIKLIVGLGNPGTEYASTRHNAGFWFVDAMVHKAGTALRNERRCHGLAARVSIYSQAIWLLQPQTFMNRSGSSVGALAHFYKILPKDILVVHDELDLPAGTAKLKFGGGSGGHNGLKDISAHLSTPQYWRLRIGIGHPRDRVQESTKANKTNKADSAAGVVQFVLKSPSKVEQALIDEAISCSLSTLPLILNGEMERAMTQLHRPREKL